MMTDGRIELFLELVRVSLGMREGLSRIPSGEEWKDLYAMAGKQAVAGICFAGVSSLADPEKGDYAGMSENLYYEWAGTAFQIQQRNEKMNRQCGELQNMLSEAGFRSSILKGQGMAAQYGEHLSSLRQCGDIDVYVDCGRREAIEFAGTIQKEVKWDYKHLHLKAFKGTEVEMHYRAQVLQNPWKNRKLQRWFKDNEDEFFSGRANLDGLTSIVVPSPRMAVFYTLLHLYHHLFAEGIGIRQMMDMYYAVRAMGDCKADADWCRAAVDFFGMHRFASAVMWIMKEVFGMPDGALLCGPDGKEGGFVLNEIMDTGNFGDRMGGGKVGIMLGTVRHNAHLLSHYTADAFSAPAYYLWHWWWKRWGILKN